MTSRMRGPFGLTLRRCLGVAGPLTLAATVLAVIFERLTRAELDGDAAAAASTWLVLPLLVAAAACSLAAAHLWPTFSLRRDGADVVRRLERGPTGGRAHVILGALCAQLLLTAPVAPLLAWQFGAPPLAARVATPPPPDAPVLDRDGATLTFSLRKPLRAESVWLRPIAALPEGGMAPSEVTLRGDGERLNTTPIAFSSTLELVRTRFAPRELRTITLTRTGGDVPLLFADGSVLVLGPPELPTWWNATLLTALAAAATLLALTLAALLGLGAGWPTVAAVLGTLHFVLWVGGVGPLDDAVLQVLRGRWLL